MDPYGSADNKAKELLRRVLPESQWAQFVDTGTLEISGSRGTYRISPFQQTAVLHSESRCPIATACLQLSDPAPAYDRLIAEYVLIRNDEDLYWQTANIFPVGLRNRDLAVFLVLLLDVMLLTTCIIQLGK